MGRGGGSLNHSLPAHCVSFYAEISSCVPILFLKPGMSPQLLSELRQQKEEEEEKKKKKSRRRKRRKKEEEEEEKEEGKKKKKKQKKKKKRRRRRRKQTFQASQT